MENLPQMFCNLNKDKSNVTILYVKTEERYICKGSLGNLLIQFVSIDTLVCMGFMMSQTLPGPVKKMSTVSILSSSKK